jgi:sugar/nucleoside kinase (ribokinase family)
VATNLLIQEKLEKTGGSVALWLKILNGIMVHRGAAAMLDPFDIPAFWLAKSRWIHLSALVVSGHFTENF